MAWSNGMDPEICGLKGISKFHIDSYNYMLDHGITAAKNNISPIRFVGSNGKLIEVVLQDATIEAQDRVDRVRGRHSYPLLPAECRMQNQTYATDLVLVFTWKEDGCPICYTHRVFKIPLMLMSNRCVLSKRRDDHDLVRFKEDENEPGGYFIVNGTEKYIRMTVIQRRNYPMAVIDHKYKQINKNFSEFGISMRCVQDDESFKEVVLHYAKDGTASLSFKYGNYYRRLVFPLLLLLKALVDETDAFIYEEIMRGDEDNTFLSECVKTMLRGNLNSGVCIQRAAKRQIGKPFLGMFSETVQNSEKVADKVIRDCVLIHLKTDLEKFTLLCYMTRKLFALVKGKSAPETINNPMYQELLTSGQLYLLVLKHYIESFLQNLKKQVERLCKETNFSLTDDVAKHCTRYACSLTPSMKNVISTGNIPLKLLLRPQTGYTVLVDRTNILNFASHFRTVMKGADIPNFIVSDLRKLRPEDWGFICPLHTPDGELTGKKNFLALSCEVVNYQPSLEQLNKLLVRLGMFPYYSFMPFDCKDAYHVILDGKVVGWVSKLSADEFVRELKTLKSLQMEGVSKFLEVVLVRSYESSLVHEGIFLFSTPGRLMRPVRNVKTKTVEYIGIFEQACGERIALQSERIKKKDVTYQELSDTNILSVVASTFPFPEFNQSSRSTFACHMGKQTVGLPFYSRRYRSDIKSQHLVYPQASLVQTEFHDVFKLNEYPVGTNAILAVMSYSGYDMEDAVILNKASVERGFKRSHLYKTVVYELKCLGEEHDPSKSPYEFGRQNDDHTHENFLDLDGLPYVGTKLEYGDPIFSYVSIATGETFVKTYKSKEVAWVDDVKVLGNIRKDLAVLNRISITFRSLRIPEIGDKFANRHGQKGVCSQLSRVQDLPFTSSGIIPDVLFNPNGLVSRMTIGMMIELMAGKVGAIRSEKQVVKTFGFTESDTACDFFCNKLEEVGYNYLGTEPMYSGVSGQQLEAHIFCGVVYYERLRHIVIDKWQVGTVAEEVDPLTQQPVKTNEDAAVRFGEMERDSLIAHGASFLLHDRLMQCSDCHAALLCTRCGELLYPVLQKASIVRPWTRRVTKQTETCRLCGERTYLTWTEVPYALIYLITEFASLNVRMKFTASEYGYFGKSYIKCKMPQSTSIP